MDDAVAKIYKTLKKEGYNKADASPQIAERLNMKKVLRKARWLNKSSQLLHLEKNLKKEKVFTQSRQTKVLNVSKSKQDIKDKEDNETISFVYLSLVKQVKCLVLAKAI